VGIVTFTVYFLKRGEQRSDSAMKVLRQCPLVLAEVSLREYMSFRKWNLL
jgi:hypothetical protein